MKKIIFIVISILIISIGYYFLNYNFGFFIPCIFHEITKLYCPGCGITRMFFSIFKLEFYQAFRYNILVFILLIFSIIYFFIKYIYFQKYKKTITINNKIIYIILIITIIFGILRNIPLFDFLKPTTI